MLICDFLGQYNGLVNFLVMFTVCLHVISKMIWSIYDKWLCVFHKEGQKFARKRLNNIIGDRFIRIGSNIMPSSTTTLTIISKECSIVRSRQWASARLWWAVSGPVPTISMRLGRDGARTPPSVWRDRAQLHRRSTVVCTWDSTHCSY